MKSRTVLLLVVAIGCGLTAAFLTNMLVKPQAEQVQLVVGFPGIPETAPERYALYVLNDVIGGSMSSRLFQEVRERQALAYSVHSGLQSYHDTGLFYISTWENYGQVFAGALVLTLVPLVLILRFQRRLVQSISTTGLK